MSNTRETNDWSPQEMRLREFSKYFFILQLVLLPTTVFLGDVIVGGIDLMADSFSDAGEVEVQTKYFWQALVVSLVASLALCAFRLWRDPRGNLEWAFPILVATGTGSACFLFYALYYGALSLYLGLGFQLLVFVCMAFLFWRADVSGRKEPPGSS